MPLMIEPLVMQTNSSQGGYTVDGDTRKIVTLVRQARELGADLIKADPTDDIDDYHLDIHAAADTPVPVRGGARVTDRTLLDRTTAVLAQGTRCIDYGLNVTQPPPHARHTAPTPAVVHDDPQQTGTSPGRDTG